MLGGGGGGGDGDGDGEYHERTTEIKPGSTKVDIDTRMPALWCIAQYSVHTTRVTTDLQACCRSKDFRTMLVGPASHPSL